MCTARFSDSWGGEGSPYIGPPRQRPPGQRLPRHREEHGTRDRDPSRRNMGRGSQTGSDIIQRTPSPMDRITDASENITLPQTSFAGGNKYHDALRPLKMTTDIGVTLD